MLKCKIWSIVSACSSWILLAVQIFVIFVESYNLKCPSPADWKFRALAKCNSTFKYFCLYNSVEEQYVEGCNGPYWDRKGSKRIYAGDFSRGECYPNRFQPILFWTNESMSDCIFVRSKCNEEGQIVYKDISTTDDRSCRCDYKKSYSFLQTPRNVGYCIPTEEDCSCYIRSCPKNVTLSADYICTQSDLKKKTLFIDTVYNKTADEKTEGSMEKEATSFSKTTSKLKPIATDAAIQISCLCIIAIIDYNTVPPISENVVIPLIKLKMNVAGAVFLKPAHSQRNQTGSNMHVTFPKWKNKTLLLFESCIKEHITESTAMDVTDTTIWSVESDTVCRNKVEPCEGALAIKEHNIVTTDEVNYLRLIHLMFRVTCPVVRMFFNDEFKPNQLRKTLNRNKSVMEKQYKKKDGIISKHQFDLLYGQVKDKTVSSEDFDLGLMINLLLTIGNINVGDSRQAQSDTSVSTMLSTIMTIHNAAATNDEGKLTNEQLEQNWGDIGQAILKLVSSRIIDVDSDEEKGQLIGRIFSLNPMNMDVKKLCIVVDLSDNDPVSILRDSINEYCTSKKDGLSVKKEHIPKSSYLPHRTLRTRKFTDITSNENNFLLVVYGITTIVYSVIKNEFRTKCSGGVLKHEDQNERTDCAEKQQKHCISTKKDKRKIIDFKSMTRHLRKKAKEENNTQTIDQLNIIDNIRRELMRSSSGVLGKKKFKDNMECIRKIVSHFGGKIYAEELLSLQQVKNILE